MGCFPRVIVYSLLINHDIKGVKGEDTFSWEKKGNSCCPTIKSYISVWVAFAWLYLLFYALYFVVFLFMSLWLQGDVCTCVCMRISVSMRQQQYCSIFPFSLWFKRAHECVYGLVLNTLIINSIYINIFSFIFLILSPRFYFPHIILLIFIFLILFSPFLFPHYYFWFLFSPKHN